MALYSLRYRNLAEFQIFFVSKIISVAFTCAVCFLNGLCNKFLSAFVNGLTSHFFHKSSRTVAIDSRGCCLLVRLLTMSCENY